MMFDANPCRVLVCFMLVLIATGLKVKEGLRGFEKEKLKIEKRINSMRLGNYLRRLMLKNNGLINNEMVFIDNSDFNIENEDINYSDMNTEGENDNDFKSRLFALKWAKANYPRSQFKPYSVTDDSNEKVKGWNILNVLLMGSNDETKVVKICFPQNLEENFAIITLFNKKCKPKIKKINEYKMFENFSYMGQKKPSTKTEESSDEVEPPKEKKPKDELLNKQQQLIEASKKQHFKEKEPVKKVVHSVKEKKQLKKAVPKKEEENNLNVEDLNLQQ